MLGCVLLSMRPEGHVVFIFIQKNYTFKEFNFRRTATVKKQESISLKALYAAKATHKGQDEIPYLRFTL